MENRNALLYKLYQASIAASFPIPEGGDPLEIARQQAEEVLGAPRVHLRLAVSNGYAYYIACDSRELASLPGYATPLAAALPDHPSHIGDSAYRVSFGDLAAAAIIKGTRLHLIVGFRHDVAESINPEGQATTTIVDVDETHGMRLESESLAYRTLGSSIARVTGVFSLVLIGLSLAVVVASKATVGFYGGGSAGSAARMAKESAALIQSTSLTPPVGDHMYRIVELTRAVVKTGGWIDSYVYSAAEGEAFTATLPGWVTSKAVEALGTNVQTHLQPGPANLIWVMQANSKGKLAPGPGPAAIKASKDQGTAK